VLARRIIPCLNVKDGRVVKGVRFSSLRDAGDPVALAQAYEAQGADEIVILDVSATPEDRAHGIETVRAVRRQLSIPLTVGGGVRSVDDAAALLDAGADKVAVNTAAVRDPDLIGVLSERFGCQCTVLALDAALFDADRWQVVVRSGAERTGRDVVSWARDAERRGAGEDLRRLRERFGGLTVRERAVMELVVAGRLNTQIAAAIGASERTVKAHRARVSSRS